MGKTLYGHAVKENVEYEWKSEPGACEVCQGMSGVVYDSANDIPDRPHPNCKCWINILEKETDETLTDPIEIRREEYKDKKRNELELAKLFGDAKSLEQEIDEYINRIDSQDKEIERLKRSIDTSMLDPKDKQKISDVKEKIDYAKYRGDKAKQDVSKIKEKIENYQRDGSIIDALDKLYYELQYAKSYADNLVPIYNETVKNIQEIKDSIEKNIENIVLKNANNENSIVMGDLYSKYHNMPEANNLFKIGLNANNYNETYVKANGKLYDSIDDLQNNNLGKDIRERIRQESAQKDCKVLVLNTDSSISKKIESSHALSRFLSENMRNLQNNTPVNNIKIEFQNDDKDLYSSLHGAVVKNAYLDSEGNLNLRIEDYYNFNPDRTSIKGQLGEKLQTQGDLEPYYIITVLKIPKEVWQKIRI